LLVRTHEHAQAEHLGCNGACSLPPNCNCTGLGLHAWRNALEFGPLKMSMSLRAPLHCQSHLGQQRLQLTLQGALDWACAKHRVKANGCQILQRTVLQLQPHAALCKPHHQPLRACGGRYACVCLSMYHVQKLIQPSCSSPGALILKAESGKQRGLLPPEQIVDTHRSASCLVKLKCTLHPHLPCHPRPPKLRMTSRLPVLCPQVHKSASCTGLHALAPRT